MVLISEKVFSHNAHAICDTVSLLSYSLSVHAPVCFSSPFDCIFLVNGIGLNMRKSTMTGDGPGNEQIGYHGVSSEQFGDTGYSNPDASQQAQSQVVKGAEDFIIPVADQPPVAVDNTINDSLMDNAGPHDVFNPGQ